MSLKLYIIGVVISVVCAADKLAFQEKEPLPIKLNKENRQPISGSGFCPDNEWYYPGDQKDDWICDCAPGYVYVPTKDKCYGVYRQGPCNNGSYLTLPKNKVIPECVTNPCKTDKMVPYKNKCYKLNTSGPCPPLAAIGGSTLTVNATTLEIDCEISENTLSIFVVPPNTPPCPPGSRRTQRGDCREVE